MLLPTSAGTPGPQWVGPDGQVHRLADYSAEIESYELTAAGEVSPEQVDLLVVYRGSFHGVAVVREHYRLASSGLAYRVELEPAQAEQSLILPIIETDGECDSTVVATDAKIEVGYRAGEFCVTAEGGTIRRTEELNTNRNARYRTYVVTPADETAPTLSRASTGGTVTGGTAADGTVTDGHGAGLHLLFE